VTQPLYVDDVISRVGNKTGDAFWPKRGGYARCQAAPVKAAWNGGVDLQRIQQRDDIAAERCLLSAAHGLR
jgi:hypothetical protein